MGLFSKLFNINNNENTDQPEIQHNYDINGKFHMTIEDVFTIIGKGTVVTGSVDSGEIHIGDTVYINEQRSTEVLAIEMFRKTLEYAKAGDNCGILLKDVTKNDIHRGDHLSK